MASLVACKQAPLNRRKALSKGIQASFHGRKRLGVFLHPPPPPSSPGRGASPAQAHLQHEIHQYPFIHLGKERHFDS